jgi:hypothetical protein
MGDKPVIRIALYIEKDMLEWIEEYRKVSRAQFIRDALYREYIRLSEIHREVQLLRQRNTD